MLANTCKSSGKVRDSDLVAGLGDAITDEEDEDEGRGSGVTHVGRQAKQVGGKQSSWVIG